MSEILEKTLLMMVSFIGFVLIFPLFTPFFATIQNFQRVSSENNIIVQDINFLEQNINEISNHSLEYSSFENISIQFNFQGKIISFFENSTQILSIFCHNKNFTIYYHREIVLVEFFQIYGLKSYVQGYNIGIENNSRFIKFF